MQNERTVSVNEALREDLFDQGTLILDTFIGPRRLRFIDERMWGHDEKEQSWCLHGGKKLRFIPK